MSHPIETLDGAKLVWTDDGKTRPMGVAVDGEKLKLIFAQPVAWISLDRATARALAKRIGEYADTGA